MKQSLQKRWAVWLLLLFVFVLQTNAQRTVNQLQFGKQTITVATDEVITFYDFKGSEDIASNSSNNSHSLTVFTPAETGKSVQITFEEIDIYPDGTSFPAYMSVYSGNPDADDSFTWATTTGGVTTSTTLPEGNILKTMGGTDKTRYQSTNETFVSNAADGSMAVGFIYKYASKCKGWVAKVQVVTLENMTITGAGSNYTNVPSSPKSKLNVPFATAYVTATGMLNADNLTGIYFKTTQNEGAIDPLTFKLYAGDGSNLKGATPLDATVAADGDGYALTLTQTLKDGTNSFTLVGDLLGTAEIGAKAAIEITKITTTAHTSGVTPFTAGTPVTVTNPAIILMNSTPQTITVGETPLNFYDEGGIDGGVECRANGTVTFVPGVSGKKVMVDFSKINIFRGSLYNQEIRVYNGTEVTAANLMKTFQDGETGVVRSTSDDGALTVVLFSDALTATENDGFEAVVSLFTPQAMTLNTITATHPTTETIVAGDEDQPILSVNIKTENTEPVLKVEKFAFTTNGTSDQITKATVYYTAAGTEFKTTTKVGEVDITADAFEITPATPVSLIEGDNYFWLAYNINEEATNGQKVDATIVSVTLDGTVSTVVGGSPDGERVIDNIVYSYAGMGTVTKKVNGSLTFKSKPYSAVPSKYEPGSEERTNIFVPVHSGKVIQLDFSSFDVYYSTSSYGQKADFKVYSGQGTTGELLWSIDNQSGPGKVLRSTAADGSMTIVFNPKASYSTYCAGGWEATVSEYESQPMAVDSVVATQTSTDDVRIGATKEPIIGFNIVTTGDQNKVKLSNVTFNLKNTQKNISKVYVYSVGKTDDEPASTDTPVGSADVDAANSELAVSIDPVVELVEGKNYFRVLVDVSGEATTDETIDMAVKSVKTDDTVTNAVNGDPDGERTIKNILNIEQGDNGEVVVSEDAPLMFYDDGGASGDGANGVEATITFVPKETGNAIKLIDKGLGLSSTSYIYFYEGGSADDSKLIMTLNGSSARFDPIVSSAEDGKITVKYIGKGSYIKPNFAIEVQSYKKKAFYVKEAAVSDVSTTEVMAGQEEVKMLRLDLTVEGDYDPIEIQQFAIDATQSAALDKVFVYATDTIGAFSAVNKFGETQTTPANVTGSYTISTEGVYKFWVAYNVKSDAAVGAQASAKLTSFTMGGTQTNLTDDVTATITVKAGMHGTFTVGTDGDYATIQAAVDAISSGVDGPVVINVKNGEYNESVNVPHIPGASETNTITVQSESGNYSDVKIYHNNYTSYTDYQEKTYGVFTINGCDWFTLKNVEVTTTDKTYPSVVQLKNESRHVTIEGCYVHADVLTDAQQSMKLIHMLPIDESNRNNDYATIKNNILEGGYIGINMGGTGYVRLPKEVGGVIEGNTLKNNGTKSIYVMDELGAKIRNNTVAIEADAATKISVGIFDFQLRDEYSEPVEVTGNIFNVAPKTYAAVFNLRQVEATAEAPMLIANNVINLASLNASYSGMKLEGAKIRNLNIAHNTIRMTGDNGGAAFWVSSTLTDGYDNINVVNNIIQNETSGYMANLYNDGNLGKINFQNNVVYTEGTNFFRAASSTTGDFNAFVTKTGATASVNKKVNFLSDNVLEPADNLDGDLLTAQALTYVTTDVTGKARPAENITIGAYEYSADNAAPVMEDDYPKVLTAIDGKATFAVKTDLAATVYCIVKKVGETAPTKDELKASENKKDVVAATETNFEEEGLETGEQYIAYFLPIGLRGAEGVISQTEAFTMTATPPVTDKPEAEVYINNETDEDTVEAGQSVTLMAMVTVDERTAPYTLTWMDSKHEVLLTQTFDSADDIDDLFTVSHTPTECTDYIFIVKDNAEKADTAFVRAIVTGEAVTATFENLYLDSESRWHCDDSRTTFVSGSYKFDSGAMPEWDFYYNFSYTNMTATTYSTLADQYNSAVGGGYDGSENYAVGYPQGGKIHVMNKADGDSIRGFYITNTAWVVDAVLNGDGMSGKFEQGDYLKLTVRADNGNTVDVYLADYRAANAADHYYLDTWQWVDLTSLGTVKNLSFSFDGTKKNTYGLTTPAYFCLDNFNGERNETTTAAQAADNGSLTVNVNDFTSLNEVGATKTYEIVGQLPDGITATVNADGTLNVTGTVDGTFDIIVKVTQRGKTEYIRIPVTIVTGIRVIGVDAKDIEGYYTIDGKRIDSPQRGINIVRMKNGTTKKLIVR